MKPIRKSRFFTISLDLIGLEERVFPFTLYVCEPQTGRHTPFLHINSPFNTQAQAMLYEMIEKGALLDISLKDRNTFLTFLNLSEEEIPSLNQVVTKWDLLQQRRIDEYADELGLEFSLVEQFKRAIISNHFSPIIERARGEILQFPYDHSATVSNAIQIAEELLKKDDTMAKTIACCYFFTLKMKIEDEDEIASIICAAAFKDIGITQINPTILQHLTELKGEDDEMWSKHPALSVFMLKKSGVQLNERTLRIILEHHERFDGRGFPRKKMVDFIDPLAELLGFFDHFFKFTDGFITGKKSTPLRTIKCMLHDVHLDGLEVNFSPGVKNLVSSHLPNLPEEKKKEDENTSS